MRGSIKVAGIVAAAALAAAACGGSSEGVGSTAQTVDAGVRAGVNAALSGSSTPGSSTTSAVPASMQDWDALGAQERDAVIKRIKANGWGKSADGRTLTGPSGFTIDLSKCPQGWSDTEGLTDTTIKIGHTTPLSGAVADYGNGGRALQAILEYYGDKGAFTDVNGKTRKVEFLMRDDGYDPARTIPLVDELIDSEKVFAMWTIGSPTTLKVYGKLNQRCIPNPLVNTGHPGWADPANHPWTTGLQLAYTTEAVLWGSFIDQHIAELGDGKITIAAIEANNDYGKAYDSSFRAYLQQSPNKDRFEFVTELVDVQAPTLKDAMTTLGAKSPDVFILMSGGVQCTQAIQEAAENGMKEQTKYLFTSQNCYGASFVGKAKVGGDGSASDGWWIMGGGIRDLNTPAEDANPYVVWARDLLRSKGYDYKASGSFGLGFLYAYPMVQALQIAGQLDGGLTRSNLMLALRSLQLTHPMLQTGIRFGMDGNKDAYFIEGSDISRYDSSRQQWVAQEIVDLSGKTPNCSWDQTTSSCR